MPVPMRGLGYMAAGSPAEERDFLALYNENLNQIKAEYRARGHYPTEREKQHARIKSAVYAATDLSHTDSMGAFFLDSQEPEDGMYGNLMPDLDWF